MCIAARPCDAAQSRFGGGGRRAVHPITLAILCLRRLASLVGLDLNRALGNARLQTQCRAGIAELKVFSEQASSVAQRVNECLAFMRDGDVLSVTKRDRPTRSTTELLAIDMRSSWKRGRGRSIGIAPSYPSWAPSAHPSALSGDHSDHPQLGVERGLILASVGRAASANLRQRAEPLSKSAPTAPATAYRWISPAGGRYLPSLNRGRGAFGCFDP